jgi:cytochrome c-type biogenesis protein CcmH
MITFWVFSIAMIIISLIFLLRPFFRDMKKDEIERSALNVNITKERLAELDIELALETITQEEYEQTREELEQALLFDVEQDKESNDLSKVNVESYNRFTRYTLLLVVPALSVVIYFYIGQPETIEGGKQQTAAARHSSGDNEKSLAAFEKMVEKLATKLKEKPDNAEGWFMLGRSYMSMNRYKEAVDALEKTNQLVPNTPTIMLRYADALITLNGGKIIDKPFDLIKRAVAIKPDEPTGLWLIGMGYDQQGDYKKAISYWELLLPLLKDNKSIDQINNLIRAAKSKAGISITENSSQAIVASKKKATTSLKVKVSIDQSMLKHVSKDDIVFIFAKAVNGPPMPLAVVRKQVKDLPIEVTLDDSMAMIPSMTLSSFNKVKITARISKSGKPLLQKGDIVSKEKNISLPFSSTINIKIDAIAK